MAPPAVFVLPFFELYSAFGLIDTHVAVALAHCLFVADSTQIPEHFEASADGTARYMRAIVMQPLCIVCHSETTDTF